MLKLQIFALFICATSVLTSSVSKTETLVSGRENHIAKQNQNDKVSSPIPIAVAATKQNLTNDNVYHAPIMIEGGPLYQTPITVPSANTSKTAAVLADAVHDASDDPAAVDTKLKLPKIRNASVVARKGAVLGPKITARKGVLESLLPLEFTTEGFEETVPIAETATGKEVIAVQNTNSTRKTVTEQKPLNNTDSNIHPHAQNNSNSVANVSILLPTPPPKRFKPKPTATIGGMDVDKPIPASPTKTPPLGMPRKIDYIVPVIITVMALPLLGGAAFFLYRRGRDCWDKRHYRRMDFLIDGMYNDYSWK